MSLFHVYFLYCFYMEKQKKNTFKIYIQFVLMQIVCCVRPTIEKFN